MVLFVYSFVSNIALIDLLNQAFLKRSHKAKIYSLPKTLLEAIECFPHLSRKYYTTLHFLFLFLIIYLFFQAVLSQELPEDYCSDKDDQFLYEKNIYFC